MSPFAIAVAPSRHRSSEAELGEEASRHDADKGGAVVAGGRIPRAPRPRSTLGGLQRHQRHGCQGRQVLTRITLEAVAWWESGMPTNQKNSGRSSNPEEG